MKTISKKGDFILLAPYIQTLSKGSQYKAAKLLR
jgi:hypothetical protein